MVPSVDAICLLSLPDSLIDGIVERSNFYAMARTNLSPTIVEGDVIKKNPCYMHPKTIELLQDATYCTSLLVTTTWVTVVYPPSVTIGSSVNEIYVYPPIGWMEFF